MRLIASLTTLISATLLTTALVACSGNSPRKPTSAQDKSAAEASMSDRCNEAYARGYSPPAGCPDPYRNSRGSSRGVQGPNIDPRGVPVPALPGNKPLL
jgi:hypothetical protein